jgi:hypothetical protein
MQSQVIAWTCLKGWQLGREVGECVYVGVGIVVQTDAKRMQMAREVK